MASSGSGLLPGIWVQGFAPPSAFGRAAVKVRGRYLKGKISASDFLREIDIFGELETYEVEQVSLPEPNSTAWRQNIKGNLDFDAAANYKGFMLLDLREENAEWKVWTPAEQEDMARGGHGSLREKYKKQGLRE